MPFALIIFGAVLFIAGIRGEHKTLAGLVQGDFTGNNNFFVWIIALGAVGALGYVKPLQKFSIGFMTLILLGIVLKTNTGVFAQFVKTVEGIPEGQSNTETNTPAAQSQTDFIGQLTKQFQQGMTP